MKKFILLFLFVSSSLHSVNKNSYDDISFNEFIYSHIRNNELYVSGNIINFKKLINLPENNCYIKFIFCSSDVKRVNLTYKASKAVHSLWGSYILDVDGFLYAFDEIRPYSPSIYFEEKPKTRSDIKILSDVKLVKSNGHFISAITKSRDIYIIGNLNNNEYPEPFKYKRLNFDAKDLFITKKNMYITDKNNIVYIVDLENGRLKKYKIIVDFHKLINADIDNGILYLNHNKKLACFECSEIFNKKMIAINKYAIQNTNNETINIVDNKNGFGLVSENKLIFKTKNYVYYKSYEFK